MTTAGLSASGFIAKRLIDIQQELADALSVTFGEVDTSADSVFGQIIGVLSKPLADLWEQMENVYFSQYPDTATGIPLDYAVALTGVTRNPATYSEGTVGLRGTDGTVVPALTQVSQSITGILFQTRTDDRVSLTDATGVIFVIESVTVGVHYAITIDGYSAEYVAVFGDSIDDVAEGLTDAINDVGGTTYTLVTAENLTGGAVLVTTKTTELTFVIVTGDMSWWTPASIVAVDKGAIPAPIGSINTIVNAVSGLDEAYNFSSIDLASTIGRDIESDDALRLRRAETLTSVGAATVEAIRSRLLNDVAGVINAYVFENDSDSVVDGRPAHSVECVVAGGSDVDIATEIWNSKAAGIVAYGHTSYYPVVDSQGNNHRIYFSRPFTRKMWIVVILTKTSEEDFPVGGETQVQEGLVAYGNGLTLGNDLFYQRLFEPIYAIPGIASVTLWISLPKFYYNIATPPANLAALLTEMETAGGFTFVNDDTFYVLDSSDTADSALATAKGSAPALNDLFKVTNIATPAISFLGNLQTPIPTSYAAYVQANISVAGTEYAEFDEVRTQVSSI